MLLCVFQFSLENAVESVTFMSKNEFCFPCVFCSQNMASDACFLLPWAYFFFFIFYIFVFFVFLGSDLQNSI